MKEAARKILLCLLLVLTVLPVSARADMGPKPSVQVDFTGMDHDTVYYVTLLSADYSTGPATAYNGNPERARYQGSDENYPIWEKFVNYSDSDGYYFLQQFKKCEGNDHYAWTYYPPSPFKVLIYFPESDTFAVSEIAERYAFDSNFTASLDEQNHAALTICKSYPFGVELAALIVRIILTILVELVMAWLFDLRTKKQLQIILCANLLTQIVLNVMLNIVAYRSGAFMFILNYILGECIVFVIEAAIYARLLPKYSDGKPIRPVLYALTANVLSFSAGMWLARLLPGIF